MHLRPIPEEPSYVREKSIRVIDKSYFFFYIPTNDNNNRFPFHFSVFRSLRLPKSLCIYLFIRQSVRTPPTQPRRSLRYRINFTRGTKLSNI